MIRDENGMLTAYVTVDLAGRDAASFMAEADRLLKPGLTLQPGYLASWGGRSEEMARASRRLGTMAVFAFLLIAVLIFLNTRSPWRTAIILLAAPFSAIGAIWSMYLLHYNFSVASWVGVIALLGVDAETGVFMLLYLELAHAEAVRRGAMRSVADLHEAIVEGAAKRLRPKFMTFAVTGLGLLPVLFSTGAGAEVTKRIAAPMVGGIFTSFLLELLVYPVAYELCRRVAMPVPATLESAAWPLHTEPELTVQAQ